MYLNIDVKKILANKAPKVDPFMESLNLLKSNQTPTNIINFMSSYRSYPKETILENLSSLCDINSDITFSYVNNVLEVADLSDDILNNYKSHISSLLESSNNIDYSNRLEDTMSIIESNIRNNNDMELIKEEVLMNLAIDRIKKSCVFESYLEDDLEVLIYNINTSPETISEYEQLIRKIKVSKTSEYFASYPMLLVKNTDLIRNMDIRVTGDVLDLLTSMPTVIANKLSEAKLSDSVIKSYIKIFDKQIAIMYMELKNNEPSQYQLYSTYVRKLIDAKRVISEKSNKKVKIEESYTDEILEEVRIKWMNPITVMKQANRVAGKGAMSHYRRNYFTMLKNSMVDTRKSYRGLWPGLLKMVDNCKTIDEVNYLRRDLAIPSFEKLKQNQPERRAAIEEHEEWLNTVYRKALNDKAKELREKEKAKLKESYLCENIAEMQPDIVMYDEGVVEDLIAEMEDSLADIIFDPGEELDDIKLENFAILCRTYEAVSRVQRTAIKAGHATGKAVQKGVNKMKDSQSNTKRAMLPVKKSLDPLINMFNNTINKIKEMDKKERTERIITGEFRLKLVGFIKKGIIGLGSLGLGVGTAKVVAKGAVNAILSPAKLGGLIVIAIGILVGVAIDKKVDAKHRRRILNDLKSELEIVNEKIEDAKSENDKKAKYELMRIRNKLIKDIERIEYNLD